MWVFLIAHDLGCIWFLFMEIENTTQLHIENDNIYEPRSVLSWYLFAFRDGVYILLGRTRPAYGDMEMLMLAVMGPFGSFFFAIIS